MNAKDAIKDNLQSADMVLVGLLDDLSDADLLVRPTPAANHVAWQIGHLITSERSMIEGVCSGTCPPLPAGFAETHSADNCRSDNSKGFLTKEQYLDLYRQQREATLKALDSLPEADLDKDSPEGIRRLCPTVGSVFSLQAMHQMWHVGQLTVLRRHLNKPVIF